MDSEILCIFAPTPPCCIRRSITTSCGNGVINCTKRDGEYLEKIGSYNPHTNPATVNIDEEVALKWLKTGAIPSDTVRNLFKEAGIMKKFAESKKTK